MTDIRAIDTTDEQAAKLAAALASDLNALIRQQANISTPEDLDQLKWPNTTLETFGAIVEAAITPARKLKADTLKRQGEIYDAAKDMALEEVRLAREHVGARPVIAARADTFTVTGQVVDQTTGAGLPDVTVAVVDEQRRLVEKLGNVATDDDGYYTIRYNLAELQEIFADQPRLMVEVRDTDGQPIARVQPELKPRGGVVAEVDARVEGDKLLASRARAELNTRLRERAIARAASRLEVVRNLARLHE